jgi:hypothetical protein
MRHEAFALAASWMNLVEVWFSVIERQAIRRGSFAIVADLTAASVPLPKAGTTVAIPSSGSRVGAAQNPPRPAGHWLDLRRALSDARTTGTAR